MKCHNCENNLYIENGVYVCKNCGYVAPIRLKKNTDVFICCTQISPQGNPTMDSMMAQDLYSRLENQNIDVFYPKMSLQEYPESDQKAAFDLAMDNARIIIITGASKANFENIVSAFGERLKNKAVLPVYSSMAESDIVKIPEMFPAINYDKPGSLDNICKDTTDILNLLESRELAPSEELRKRKKKQITIIISALAAVVIALGIIAYMLFIAPRISDAKNYKKAQHLADEQKYIQAIDMYYDLGNYKDSVDLLGRLYSRYDGFYYDENKMIDLELKIVNRVAKIKINEYYGNKVISAKTSGDVKNNIISFEYKDSSAVTGKGTIELFDDCLKLTIISDGSNKYCISSGTVEFPLEKTSESPSTLEVDEITVKHVIKWLDDGITKSELEEMGYNLEPADTIHHSDNTKSVRYKVSETDIIAEFVINSGNNADNAPLFSVISPAGFLIPDSVGEVCLPFEKNDIVYWPGEGVYWGNDSHWDEAIVPAENKIRKSTPITLTTKDSYSRSGTWDELLESVFQRNVGTNIGSEEFTVDAENEESFLVSYKDGNVIKFYKVSKINFEATYITKLHPERGQTSQDLIEENRDLFSEFLKEDSDTDIFYRVRKSADDASSQLGAFDNLDKAKALADEHKDEGYKVYDNKGKLIYSP